jgi:hypothetical protein
LGTTAAPDPSRLRAVGHDLDREMALSIEVIQAHLEKKRLPGTMTKVRIYTKYSCN